jgi:RecA-family ATPase
MAQVIPLAQPQTDSYGYEQMLLMRERRDERRAKKLQEQEAPEIEWVRASDWHGKPVPEPRWLVQKFIPYRNVTQHTGDGGVGKSLLDLQLAVAVVANRKWIGMPIEITGPVIVYSAEDELEETWRRVADICTAEDIKLSALGDLHIAPLAGMDAMLSIADERGGNGSMTPTPLWHQLVRKAGDIRPKLVVIDTSADVFGGDEIKRRQVRQFVGMLRSLAFDFDCAVVLLSHPSVAGINDGTGRSGSTGWNNAFRGRMYQERVIVRDGTFVSEPDPDLRVLRNNKLNYGRTGAGIRIRYDVEHDVFVNEQADEVSAADAAVAAERVFLECLAEIEAQGREVNTLKNGSKYAPKVFAGLRAAAGYTKHQLGAAMERLLNDRQIRIGQAGPPSALRYFLTTKQATEPVEEPAPEPVPAAPTALDRAVEWLRNRLAAGPVESSTLYADGMAAMISRTTLRRAADEVGVKSDSDGVYTMLRLPE